MRWHETQGSAVELEVRRCLAGHISKHAMHWFWYLIDPTIQTTNHWPEPAIRPAVDNHKVRCDNRVGPGAKAQSILTSVIRSRGQRDVDPFAFLRDALCRHKPRRITAWDGNQLRSRLSKRMDRYFDFQAGRQ